MTENNNTANLRARKKQKTRRDILEASKKLFEDKGLPEVSVDDIAQSAFISRPTVYNYFPHGKDEIFFQIGINIFEKSDPILRDQLAEIETGLEQFLFMCEMTFKVAESQPILFVIIAEFYNRLKTREVPFEQSHDEIAKIAFSENYDKYRENYDKPYLLDFYCEMQRSAFLWGSTVKKGKKDGSIKREEDPDHILHFTHLTITGVIEQSLYRIATLSRIELGYETIKTWTLQLIKTYLLEI